MILEPYYIPDYCAILPLVSVARQGGEWLIEVGWLWWGAFVVFGGDVC